MARHESSSPRLSVRLVRAGLLALALWMLLRALGPAAHAAAVLLVIVGVIVVAVWWWRWFPRRATGELRAVIGMVVPPKLRRVRRRGLVWELAWRMPSMVSVSGLQRRREMIEQALDCSAEFWYDRGLFWMRAGVGRLPQRMTFREFYARWRPAGDLVLGVGASRTGSMWLDLPQVPHLLVGGTPGSGKSVFLRQAITGLVLHHPPEELRLVLIDLKGGMEFNVFERLPHLMAPVVSDVPECGPVLEAVLTELDRRQALFAGLGVEKLSRWNALRPDARLPHVLVVVDEFAEVSAVESSEGGTRARARASLAPFSRIARLGRASGIHLVLSTQRPDYEVLPGQIKANVPATVAFRTRSAVNSHILLGERNDAAAVLPPWPGRGICQWESEAEIQAPDLSKEEAATLLAERYPVAAAEGTERVTPCPQSPEAEGT